MTWTYSLEIAPGYTPDAVRAPFEIALMMAMGNALLSCPPSGLKRRKRVLQANWGINGIDYLPDDILTNEGEHLTFLATHF